MIEVTFNNLLKLDLTEGKYKVDLSYFIYIYYILPKCVKIVKFKKCSLIYYLDQYLQTS